MSRKQHACPKCGKRLDASGVVTVNGGPDLPVYQCDTCTRVVPVFGEVAVTFCVDENGRAFDPADPDSPFSVN